MVDELAALGFLEGALQVGVTQDGCEVAKGPLNGRDRD